jgi:TetR/AcrR family fatty acid metabolism transcriptional regulator
MDNAVESRSPGQLRQEKRDRILDAAIAVFAEKGFTLSRVSDVASRAGVADGTIYLYFKTKDDILLAVFEEKMETLVQEMDRHLATVDGPVERIRAFGRFHFQMVQTYPELAQVLQVEVRQSHHFLRNYRPVKLWAYLDRIEGLVVEGQAQGLFREDVDPFIVKWAFFGALDELSVQWVLARRRERFTPEHSAEQVVEVFLRGLMANP